MVEHKGWVDLRTSKRKLGNRKKYGCQDFGGCFPQSKTSLHPVEISISVCFVPSFFQNILLVPTTLFNQKFCKMNSSVRKRGFSNSELFLKQILITFSL